MENKSGYQLFDYDKSSNNVTIHEGDYLVKALYKYVFEKWDFRTVNIDMDSFEKAVGLVKSKFQIILTYKDTAQTQFKNDISSEDILLLKHWLFAYMISRCNNNTPTQIVDFWKENQRLLHHVTRIKDVDIFIQEEYPLLVNHYRSAVNNIENTTKNNNVREALIFLANNETKKIINEVKKNIDTINYSYQQMITNLQNECISLSVQLEALRYQYNIIKEDKGKVDDELRLAKSEETIERLKFEGELSLICKILECAAGDSDSQSRRTIRGLMLEITRNEKYQTKEINDAIDLLKKDYNEALRHEIVDAIKNIQLNITNNFNEKVDKVENH